MRLLFDQNLASKLAGSLSDIFPGSIHVRNVGLDCADDRHIWEYAHKNGLTIVTKDSDFNILSVYNGFPPKVIWLKTGNCTTTRIETLFRSRFADIQAFQADPTLGTLVISD